MERLLCRKWLPCRRVDVWLRMCKSQLLPELLTHSWIQAMDTKHDSLPASLVLSVWLKSGALWKENFISLAANLPLLPVYPKGVQTHSERARVTQPSLLWWACNYLACTLRLININFTYVYTVHLKWKQHALLLNQIRAIKLFPF